MSFSSLNLSDFLLNALTDLGYTEPTPVQLKAIPATLEGKDVLAAAETGSGKTAGFVLPILERMKDSIPPRSNHANVLILVPTRELAVQVEEAVQQYAKYFPRRLKSLAVYGGVSINTQMQAMRSGCDIVVATPGRLIDLFKRNAIDLRAVHSLVLDEADRMLDLGFSDELDDILDELPEQRQNLLFSATFPHSVRTLTQEILNNPIEISIKQEATIPEQLAQRAIEVDRTNRTMLLKHLLKTENWSRVLIFVASKRTANNVILKLSRADINAQALHGDLTQAERSGALADFKSGKCKILVATDLAARGIDIPNLPCVLNYDLPRSPADYVHRIGRTGRAGEIGLALSFIDHEGDSHFKLIEKRIKQTLEREQIEGFERDSIVPIEVREQKGQAPVKGKRMSKKDRIRAAEAAKKIWGEK
ncbi:MULTISPECIES: DEAD/DEAH box helicase [unclassified Neptuniibacter]|jgi:superfamily II DNA/RNA helicase|uniref:DEAD/DEAH box helicase n=1 Tax=unclassified Neptuniibacter TaxID=2630693 RepID=UPI0026E2D127|nr:MULTISPECIES: DEAD/DEAH box helicase [unclassified Neptuniibacter]MDO6513123.1 DEAD/DEAH box helicase [Neptuniibacter sp. 2_MG-2023]MDO6592465.1 DEAD/DEAH box helicase [Neptuniibacter sp. 1_MG-2023]